MKSRLLVAAVAFLGYAILDATPANADPFTSDSTGNWCDRHTWDDTEVEDPDCLASVAGTDYPGTGDSATVAATHDVTLSGPEQCGSLTINDGGDVYTLGNKLIVENSAGLDLDPEVASHAGRLHIAASGEVELQGGGSHPIDGEIHLLGSGSTLSILPTVSPLTMSGAGSLEGYDNGALITIASTKRLTNGIEIKGNLQITGDGHFRNSNIVRASTGGNMVLNLNVGGTLDDVASTDQWIVSVAGAVLRFSTSANLLGKMEVSSGTLNVQTAFDVCTTGVVEHSGGSIVIDDSDASFGRSSSCPL